MALISDLTTRISTPEIMDQPGLDAERHRAALTGLGRINSVSRSANILWPPIAAAAQTNSKLTILDVACGGGDIAVALSQKAKKHGLAVRIDGCDISSIALEFARQNARRAELDVRFFQADVINEPIPTGYDIIICSLFLHHLSEPQAIRFLRGIGKAAKEMVIVQDLRRSRLGLMLAHLAGRVLTRSDVVRNDGPASVRAAFTVKEAKSLAERAKLEDAIFTRHWPCRWRMVWEAPLLHPERP
ncbi:MAG: methyltransferase domain-containing protein [Gemmataceae bacterium]